MLEQITHKIVNHQIEKGILQESDRNIYQYGYQMLIEFGINILASIVIAILFQAFEIVIVFTIAYLVMRGYAGGYHAKTILGCLILSLLLELIFLVVLPHYLFMPLSFIILILCALAILILAPYNHPKLHLTSEEIKSCQRKVRLRLCCILMVAAISYSAGIREITNGCTISIAMATTLLCLGYINDWGDNLWKKMLLRKSRERPSKE